ncbi:complement C1q and tumor necrosis factor-related protein 9A-like [Mercenaria mercenaria]|uniref:complement C1q and tumor necrosis factor-related protein 9A-like n=1 Tax=Mercenaria mercenaria TaxID=6596 RepID=UPI00234EF2FF|nr:complement C1q and tumor necrosis factor-related protein 9A-like [Mercenaria mercenaria]
MLFSANFALVFLFQIYVFNVSFAKEPMCSKFAYEEQLLEKMIRTEIRVETIDIEIKKTQETVLNTLNDIKKTVADMTDRFEDLRNNITEVMEQKIRDIEEIEEKMTRPSVAFFAHHVSDVSLHVTDKIIIFDSITTNEGSGYDTSTGVFTAPVGGMFQFTVNFCTYKQKDSPIALVLAGKQIARSSNYDKDSHTCGSFSATARVKSGEKVWVKCVYGSSSYSLWQDSWKMNSFSGFLLYQ